MENIAASSEEDLKIHSLKMNEVGYDSPPLNVSAPLAVPATQANTGTAPATNDRSYKAVANVFGKEGVPVKGSLLDDGSHLALLNFAPSGFSFDQLFNNFLSDTNNLFLFDDVSIQLEQKPDDTTAHVIDFLGTLRMDTGFLAAFKNFLKLDKGLVLSASIDVGGQDLSAKLVPSAFTLKSAAQFNFPVADNVLLSSASFKIGIEKQTDPVSNQVSWRFSPAVSGTLTLTNVGKTPVNMAAEVTYANGALQLNASVANVSGLFGVDGLNLQTLKAEFEAGNEKSITLSAKYSAGFRTFDFTGKVASGYAAMTASAANFTDDDLNDIFRSLSANKLSLPDYDITFNKVLIGLATADTTLGTTALAKGFTIQCSINVQGHECEAKALISPDGISFEGGLGATTIGPVNINQAKLKMQFYSTSSGKPSAFALLGSTTVQGLTVDCKVAYEKLGTTWNAVVYGALNANSFGMSTLFPQAAGTFIDTLKFSKVAIIYASADSTTQDPDLALPVKKGLQLTGILQEIPALSQLTRNKQIGLQLTAVLGTTTSIGIALPDTRLNLGRSVTCDPFNIAITILPQPEFALVYGMDVLVPKQDTPLHFDLKLGIGVAGANGSGTMKGYWQNPFGVNGLQIGPDLAMQVDIIYAQFVSTGTPSGFGIVGGIKLGDVVGKMALSITEDPTKEILYGEVDNLSPANLVKFASTITGLQLKKDDVPNFFDLKQLKLYCAPTGGTIGTVTFEQGFSFACDLVLFEKEIAVYTSFNQSGVTAKGHLDKLEVGPLKIKGQNGQNAELELALNTNKQAILIDGAIDFMNSHAGLYVDVSKQGVAFYFDQNFENLLKYTISGKSEGSLSDPASIDFLLSSEFTNDLTDYLKNTLSQKIRDAVKVSDTSIDALQQDLTNKEKAYMALYEPAFAGLTKAQADADAYLKSCQQKVQTEQQKWDAALLDAQNKVAGAKQKYDTAFQNAQKAVTDAQIKYNNNLRAAQEAVNQAQARYNTAFTNAQNAVNAAKARYDSAFGSAINQLNNYQYQVNSLQSQINSTQYEIDHLAWYESGKAIYLGPKLLGLKAAKETANGFLIAARAVVNGFASTTEAITLTAANKALSIVKTTGEFAAFQTAQKTLQAVQYGSDYVAFQTAQKVLNGIQYGGEYTVWQGAVQTLDITQTTGRATLTAAEHTLSSVGTSAAYLALELARSTVEAVKKSTAALSYEQAKGYLEAAQLGAGALLNLSAYIATHAGDLVDVKHVALSARLKDIEKGKLLKSNIDMAVLGKPYNWTLDFNVQDTKAFIEQLFQQSLTEAKKIVKVS